VSADIWIAIKDYEVVSAAVKDGVFRVAGRILLRFTKEAR